MFPCSLCHPGSAVLVQRRVCRKRLYLRCHTPVTPLLLFLHPSLPLVSPKQPLGTGSTYALRVFMANRNEGGEWRLQCWLNIATGLLSRRKHHQIDYTCSCLSFLAQGRVVALEMLFRQGHVSLSFRGCPGQDVTLCHCSCGVWQSGRDPKVFTYRTTECVGWKGP